MSGVKHDSGKPKLSIIPKDALWGMAKALTYGADKYGLHNFRDGIAFTRLADAALRHLTVWMEGEQIDSESGNDHLDHAMASLAMLKFMATNKPEFDDRWINHIHEIPEVKTQEEIDMENMRTYMKQRELQNYVDSNPENLVDPISKETNESN